MDVKAPDEGQYRFGPFLLNPAERLLLRDGAAVPLTHRLFETLLTFVRSPGRVLTKDELLEAVWPGRYMEEASLKQAVFTLRKALSDSGEDARYIVTAPGIGYSFAAPVQKLNRARDAAKFEAPSQIPSPTVTEPSRRRSSATPYIALVLIVAALVAGLAIYEWYRNVPPSPAKPNVLVLADFQNFTNDPALGTVLGKVLEIDLSQSPFLTVLSPQQVTETLQMMERPGDSRLTPALAQEVCARDQGNAFLNGAVAQVGAHFLVTLQARSCASGSSIAEDKARADQKDDLPNVLDTLAVRVRQGMQESPASIGRFDVPIADATTSSFEALKAFSIGEAARVKGDNAGALPFFKRAVELDPQFAMANEEIAGCYLSLREQDLARPYFRKAFELRDRTSENEKLWISATYYRFLGDLTESLHNYQAWTQIYPGDWRPWTSMAGLYTAMARYDEAIAAARTGLRLNPRHDLSYVVLARAYKRATRFAESEAVARDAIAKKLDGFDIHGLLYEVAYARGDTATMEAQVANERGKPTEDWMIEYEAWTAATDGRLGSSRALFEKAIALADAQGPDAHDIVRGFYTEYMEMLADFELTAEARGLAQRVPDLDENENAAFSFAWAGDFQQAALAAAALRKRNPDSTTVNDIYIPWTKAAIDLRQNKPQDAVAVLEPARPYELFDFKMPSLLGAAYLEMKAPEKAAAEYHLILANRGVDANSPLYPLAYLGLARALHMQGKNQESKAAYENLLAFWKNADKDLPMLMDARREYAELESAKHS
jgi:eukaryotic-like serine/threonine-protein kinase